jgi:hypothetical protein
MNEMGRESFQRLNYFNILFRKEVPCYYQHEDIITEWMAEV